MCLRDVLPVLRYNMFEALAVSFNVQASKHPTYPKHCLLGLLNFDTC